MQTTDGIEPVDLGGPRTIREAERTRSLLLEAVCSRPAVSLNCSAVTEADLSLVQLLLSARTAAELSGKTLTLTRPPTGAFLQVLSQAGFAPTPDPLTGNESYWLQKEGDDVQDHSCRG